MLSMWNVVISSLRESLSNDEYEAWIEPIKYSSFKGRILQVSVPSPFIRDYVNKNYRSKIIEQWNKQAEQSILDLEIVVKFTSKSQSLPINDSDEPTIIAEFNPEQASPLNPDYTFENFVVGSSNQLAYTAAKRVAEGYDSSFNPLFIYGGTGLGKTHLMQAIAHYSKISKAGRKILYVSGEQFVLSFVKSITGRSSEEFKKLFRKVDVLMVDDIQFIAGKGASQEEFLHTFNTLVESGKQVVMSADRAPSELESIDKRLISRMQKGLVVDVHKTTYELRLGILEKKVELAKIKNPNLIVPHEVLPFLALRITSNVRELEGALNRIIIFSEMMNRPITLDNVENDLREVLKSNISQISVDDIQKKVAEYYKIKTSDMRSLSKARSVAFPRQVAMYIAKELTTLSLPDIGRSFGGRDHSTVIYAIDKIKREQLINSKLNEDIRILLRIFEN